MEKKEDKEKQWRRKRIRKSNGEEDKGKAIGKKEDKEKNGERR